MSDYVVVLNGADNVATAMTALQEGTVVVVGGDSSVTTTEAIPFGHKIALTAIEKGAKIIKYGEPIGVALESIALGACVHVHNVESERGRGDKERSQ